MIEYNGEVGDFASSFGHGANGSRNARVARLPHTSQRLRKSRAKLGLKGYRLALETAITEAAGNDHAKVVAKQVAEAALDNALIAESLYESNTCMGDEIKILSNGFEVRKDPAPIGPLQAPAKLEARMSEFSGHIDLRWKPMDGASYYQVAMNDTDPNDESKWVLTAFSSAAHYTVTGPVSGKFYWFRVVALGAAGPSPASDPAKGLAA